MIRALRRLTHEISRPLVAVVVGVLSLGDWTSAQTTSRASTANPPAADPWIAGQIMELVDLYKHLHSHPELSNQEVETSKRIAKELAAAGAEVTADFGGHGVVGVMRNGPGPVVLVRTDMDALPVVEATGLPYASTVKAKDPLGREVGVMHACGHDIHMTAFIGTARCLTAHRDRWSGTVVFIGQPAEETIGGAKQMLGAGLYTRFPKPDYALALHCKGDDAAGTIHYRPGPMLASSTSVNITVRGKGGHGAWPHRTIDPIVLSALLIVDLQTIVSREVEPLEPAVVTVGSIHGGTKHNIIPDEVKLQLTLRTFSEPVRLHLVDAIKRRAAALAESHRAPAPTVEIQESTPPTINSPALVEKVVPAFVGALGVANVSPAKPVMGAEDFALFSQSDVPICMFWIGTISPERLSAAKSKGEDMPALHSAKYYPEPAESITAGIRAMTSAVVKLLPPAR